MDIDVIALGEGMVEFTARRVGLLKVARLFELGWGGDTSNTVVALSRLGKKAGYISRVGDDEFGRSLLEMWRKEGVDTSHVAVEKGGITGIYFVSRLSGGRHDFTYYRKDSAASHLSVDDLEPEYLRSARIFHVSGISQAISASCREAVLKAIRTVKDSGGIVSYDPNIRTKLLPIEATREMIYDTLKMVDIALPSLEDAALLTGLQSPEEDAQDLLKLGPKLVVLKLGFEGCLVIEAGKVVRIPPYSIKVLDTTGAGDAFNAGFITGFLEWRDPIKAARFANAVAALKVSQIGAVRNLPYRSKVMELLNDA